MLGSFDEAVDCAIANNRLKRRGGISEQGEFGNKPQLAHNIRSKTIFLARSEHRFA
jgi:hypothetical protein